MRVYKNNFTLDGRVKLAPGVSQRKVEAVRSLTERHLAGDNIATATLHEALTTSDAVFNMAHLATLNFVPNFDEAERNWSTIAGTRTVPDLKPVTLFSLNRSWTDGNGDSQVLDTHDGALVNGAAPTIPEGTAYPYAYISGQVSEGAGVKKRGFQTDWTLESRINDGLAVLDELPNQMLEVSLDTEEADVWGAFRSQGLNHPLEGGDVPMAQAAVPGNAPISRDAIARAIIELAERRINGRKIRVTGGYNLLVPVGQGIFVNAILNQNIATVTDGALVLNYNGGNPLTAVTVVETEWLDGTEWALMPKKGATRRPVIERLDLRGYQNPQLFVDNHTGNFVGGATVSPFEGSFAADVITLKLRQFGGGVVWDDGIAIVYSTGVPTP